MTATTIPAHTLAAACRLLTPIVQRRSTVPILTAIRIGQGAITGTDLDVEVQVAIPTTLKKREALVIDFRSLRAIAGHVEKDEQIEIKGGNGIEPVSVSFNGSAYALPAYRPDDFPVFSGDLPTGRAETMQIDNIGLLDALKAVHFAISPDECRYYLNGVALMTDKAGTMYAAATDGHRLALYPLPTPIDAADKAILPRKLVDYLLATSPKLKSATFEEGVAKVALDCEGMRIQSKLIDGTYPDIWRVIPADPVPVFSINRAAALRVLRRMSAVSAAFGAAEGRAVKIEADGKDSLHLSMRGPLGNTGSERLAYAPDTDQPFTVGFNVRYLIDALVHLKSESIHFSVAAKDAAEGVKQIGGVPWLIQGDDDALTITLMPMRV